MSNYVTEKQTGKIFQRSDVTVKGFNGAMWGTAPTHAPVRWAALGVLPHKTTHLLKECTLLGKNKAQDDSSSLGLRGRAHGTICALFPPHQQDKC